MTDQNRSSIAPKQGRADGSVGSRLQASFVKVMCGFGFRHDSEGSPWITTQIAKSLTSVRLREQVGTYHKCLELIAASLAREMFMLTRLQNIANSKPCVAERYFRYLN